MNWTSYGAASNVDSGVYNSFRLNFIYDFNWSVVFAGELNSQSIGFDQMFSLYKRFRVHAVAIRIRWFNDTQFVSVINMLPSGTTDSGTIPDQRSTNMYVQTRRRGAISRSVAGSNSNGAKNITSFRQYYQPRKILGLTKEQYRTDPETAGVMGEAANGAADPEKVALLTLQQWKMSNPTSSLDVSYQYELHMQFYVELFDPKYLVTSE